MKVLFVTSEAYPFVKVGGLGDVAYALPKSLKKIGVDIRVIMPKYESIREEFKERMTTVSEFSVSLGWRNKYCGIQCLEENGIKFYFIDNEEYFKRPYTYGYDDECERYAYFSMGVLEGIKYIDDFVPDIIHCNDWHTGMIPVLLREKYKFQEKYNNIRSVYTIHNLKYQGVFSRNVLEDILGLDHRYFREDALKYYDGISFMKGGINYSNAVTTVSKTYSEEIKTYEYGEGLQGMFEYINKPFLGIVNGIDYEDYNPEKSEYGLKPYNIDGINIKKENKLSLQRKLGLKVDENIPMIGIVSRLVEQKGFDIIARVMEDICGLKLQLVVLGTGDIEYEDLFKYYANMYPDKVSAQIYFDNSMAKKIYASSDMFLMPSLFEPCGIGQLIAMRYGTVPIVRETGGLRDTVEAYNEYTGEGTGFSFRNSDSYEMLKIIKYALSVFNNEITWNVIVKSAMNKNSSYDESAKEYKLLYESLL